MARQPKPWYRKDRDAWFVTISGARHNLGPNKKKAFDRFYDLMREPGTAKVISQSFAAIADAFLDWVKANRARPDLRVVPVPLARTCAVLPNGGFDQAEPYLMHWFMGEPAIGDYLYVPRNRLLSLKAVWAAKKPHIPWIPPPGGVEDEQI